jgi:predicted nucleic acid-binding protein
VGSGTQQLTLRVACRIIIRRRHGAAATAELHGLMMVTRNEKDFPKTLALVNPWKI